MEAQSLAGRASGRAEKPRNGFYCSAAPARCLTQPRLPAQGAYAAQHSGETCAGAVHGLAHRISWLRCGGFRHFCLHPRPSATGRPMAAAVALAFLRRVSWRLGRRGVRDRVALRGELGGGHFGGGGGQLGCELPSLRRARARFTAYFLLGEFGRVLRGHMGAQARGMVCFPTVFAFFLSEAALAPIWILLACVPFMFRSSLFGEHPTAV